MPLGRIFYWGWGVRVREVECGVWGVGKETSFICDGKNFFIGAAP